MTSNSRSASRTPARNQKPEVGGLPLPLRDGRTNFATVPDFNQGDFDRTFSSASALPISIYTYQRYANLEMEGTESCEPLLPDTATVASSTTASPTTSEMSDNSMDNHDVAMPPVSAEPAHTTKASNVTTEPQAFELSVSEHDAVEAPFSGPEPIAVTMAITPAVDHPVPALPTRDIDTATNAVCTPAAATTASTAAVTPSAPRPRVGHGKAAKPPLCRKWLDGGQCPRRGVDCH